MALIGLQNGAGPISKGEYTVVTADDTAGTKAIDTGLSNIDVAIVQIARANVIITADAAISHSAGTLTVADGAATYALTANDVIRWIAIGT